MVLFTVFILATALLAIFKIYNRLTSGRCISKRNLTGKVAIVTGSNAGIGLETVKDLLMRNARVIMACRNLEKGKAALRKFSEESIINN